MSVELGIYIVDWLEVTRRLQESEDPFEEEIFENLESFELSYASLSGQLDFLEHYNLAAPHLSSDTRAKLDEFLNTMFWSWREDQGKQIMEMDVELDELDTALSPQTVKRFAAMWEKVSVSELKRAFDALDGPAKLDWIEYIEGYGNALKQAASSNNGLLIVVFG